MTPKKYYALTNAEGSAFAYFYAGRILFNHNVPLQSGMWAEKPGFDPEDLLRKAQKVVDKEVDSLQMSIQGLRAERDADRLSQTPMLDWRSDQISMYENQINNARQTLVGLRIVTITVEPWPLKP